MESLEGSKDFTEVFLVSQAEVKGGETQRGTGFTITCKANIR
jgi:type IV pilus assembly protein PilN